MKELKDLIKLFNIKYESKLDYSKDLKKISEINTFSVESSTLSKGFNHLKNDILCQEIYIVEFLNNIKEEILNPLKRYQNANNSIGDVLNEEIKSREKAYKSAFEKYEKFKKSYINCVKQREELAFKLEQLKKEQNIEQFTKLKIKYEISIKDEKEAETLYREQIYTTNLYRDELELKANTVFKEFQKNEEDYIDFVKNILRKYNIYELHLTKNMHYDIDRKGKTIETIDKYEDISNFLKNFSCPGSFPSKVEFTEFSTTKSCNLSVTSNVNINIIPKTPLPLNEQSDLHTFPLKEIDELVKSINDGIIKKENLSKNLNSYLAQRKFRKYFLESMKQICSNQLKIQQETNNIIDQIYLDLLNKMNEEKDYENFLNFFITYKVLNKDKVNYKEMLKNTMSCFWNNLEFWRTIIYNCFQNETYTYSDNKKDSRLNEVICGCKFAIDFGINKDDIIQIIEDKKEQFSISDQNLLKLILFINDYYREN